MEHDVRPWGAYWVLEDAEAHKIKRILVNQGGKLSSQFHKYIAEVCKIVSGKNILTTEKVAKYWEVGEIVDNYIAKHIIFDSLKKINS